MNLILYPKLKARSREAILDRPTYYPFPSLVDRLARQTGLSPNQVRLRLRLEREYLLRILDSAL
ncbi:hypothetical protein QUA42_25790 [Microcoleus sp. Pol11C2]|uniref:hypothetical protein n=1 Tax=Microcoleus sp. Pol11C2 TaxID=3055389 RepID=UPI002FD3D8CA